MMTEFPEHVRRQWFAVALSRAIDAKPTRAFLLGWPIVLARGEGGHIIALADRCPHQGAPLSDGRMEPRGLSCKSHGWTFDDSGRCTAMPGKTEPPSSDIRVAAYAVIERDGLVWAGRSKAHPLPERVSAMKAENLKFVCQSKVTHPVIDAQEAVFSGVLVREIHPAGGSRRSEVEPKVSVEGDGFKFEHPGRSLQSGFLFRLFESSRTNERAYVSSSSTVQFEYRYANGGAVWITVCFTPETLVSTRLFATLHVEVRWVPGWLVRSLISPAVAVDEGILGGASLNRVRHCLQQAWSTSTAAL